ncbi:methionine adenosyltransferase [Christensenellaceae bacterium 44-20]
MNRLFTSESVTEGHPDKICDQISDAVLDAILEQDKQARVACDTAVNTGLVLVMGEITTSAYVDIPKIARDTIRKIGYTGGASGFDADACAVLTSIDEQSADIAMGVNEALETRGTGARETGAGDQGMMFGYACRETAEYMPLPIAAAHALTKRLAQVRKEKILDFLMPDGKSQVSVEYENGRPKRIDTIVVSSQHLDIPVERVREGIIEEVILPTIDPKLIDNKTRILVNPTGRFVIGGPRGDSGLTGRKIIVDTYGGYARHGGGAFSGKDPTKVDRSAAYAARYVAKNIVAAGLAEQCEIELAYAIGVAQPVSVLADTYGTGKFSDEKLAEIIRRNFDLRPGSIIEDLHLRETKFCPTAAYGHFGRADLDLPWERLERVAQLKEEK